MNATDFPSKLRNRRRLLGLSQRRLSALIGVSHQVVSQYEAGLVCPTPARRAVIAATLADPGLTGKNNDHTTWGSMGRIESAGGLTPRGADIDARTLLDAIARLPSDKLISLAEALIATAIALRGEEGAP